MAVSADVAGRLDDRENETLVGDIGSVMKALVSEAVTPLLARIAELEAREPCLRAAAENALAGAVGRPTDAGPHDDDPVIAQIAEHLGRELSARFKKVPTPIRRPISEAVLEVAGQMLGGIAALRARVAALETGAPVASAGTSMALEARVAALEGRPQQAMDFRGLWQPERYEAGAWVTFDGALWRAKVETDDKPGTSAAWGLIVQRGKTGKPGPMGPRGPAGGT